MHQFGGITNQQLADPATGTRDEPAPEPTTAPLPAHILVVLVAVVAGVCAQGAFYGRGQRIVAVLMAAAVVTALSARRWSGDDARLPVVVAGTGLAAWAVVSATVNGHPWASLSTIAVAVGIVAAVVVVRRTTPAQRQAVAATLVCFGALIAVAGWIGVAWRISPWALVDQGLWRAATTITYANASAALLVPLALLGLAQLTADRRSPWLLATTCLLLVGAGATLSRAGGLSLVAGLAVLVIARGPKAVLGAAGPTAAGAALALVALTPSMAADSPGRPWLATAGLIAGVAMSAGFARTGRRTDRIAVAAGAFGVLVLLVGFAAAIGPEQAAATRLNLSSPDRARETTAAVDLVTGRPLTGVGPGRATLRWTDAGGDVMAARFAHDEYLQVAAELGLVGLALALALIGAIGVVVWRGRPSMSGDCPPALWAGVAAALVALLVHSGLDFVWHVTVLPLLGAVLAGLATPQPTNKENP